MTRPLAPRLGACAVASWALTVNAAPAEAHLNATGMGPIYDGVMHVLTSPEDLVPVIALALLAGLRGAAHGRRASFVLPVAWLLGSLAGMPASATTGHAILSSAWFLLLGGLVVADARLSVPALTVVAALVVPLRAHWARIAVRVAGSWVVASGLLMLGWSFRGGR